MSCQSSACVYPIRKTTHIHKYIYADSSYMLDNQYHITVFFSFIFIPLFFFFLQKLFYIYSIHNKKKISYPTISPRPNLYVPLTWLANPLRAKVNGSGSNLFSRVAPTHQFESNWPENIRETPIRSLCRSSIVIMYLK